MDRRTPNAFATLVAAILVGSTINAADADTRAQESALTASGDAFLSANQYAAAEAAYLEALRLAEQDGEPEGERVLAPLLGIGSLRARSGHHEEAIPLLQRAVAITRAQYGVFDLRQQEALKTLAGSLTAVDRLAEAQELMLYRVRAAEKTYGEGSPKLIPTVCDLGDWFAETGKTPEALMTFQMALNIVGTTPSLNAPIIVQPLRGIARAHMLRPSYPDTWRRPMTPSDCGAGGARCSPPFHNDGKLIVEPRELNPDGERALERALRILEADPDASPQTLIETLLQMGDWHQIAKSPREALPYYQRAWELARNAPTLSASTLAIPVRVYYPTPQIAAHVPATTPEETRRHSVNIEFTVAADGSVKHARIVDHDSRDRYARDILEAVRDSRFRPKFVEGRPVAADGITYNEVFWTGKPRT